jgi:hypothetical protein
MIWLTMSAAACGWPLRKRQRALSGSTKWTITGTTVITSPPGNARKRKAFGLPASRKEINGTKVKEAASAIS